MTAWLGRLVGVARDGDKRMFKSQQMRWDPRSAHLLLQVRVRVIDGQLRDDFARWYPGFPSNASTLPLSA